MSDLESNFVTIGGQNVDIADPCQLCRALQAYRIQLATGGAVEEFEIRSPITNRRTKFASGSKPEALDAMIADAKSACEAALGNPAPRRKRHALAGQMRPY